MQLHVIHTAHSFFLKFMLYPLLYSLLVIFSFWFSFFSNTIYMTFLHEATNTEVRLVCWKGTFEIYHDTKLNRSRHPCQYQQFHNQYSKISMCIAKNVFLLSTNIGVNICSCFVKLQLTLQETYVMNGQDALIKTPQYISGVVLQ